MNQHSEERSEAAAPGGSQPLNKKNTAQLEEEIEKIRMEMNSTLNDIERRFSAGDLLDRALHYFEGSPKDYASTVGRAIRENPIPALLAGVGLAWLAFDATGRHVESEGKWQGEAQPSWRERTRALAARMNRSGSNRRDRREQAILEREWARKAAGGGFRFQIQRARTGFTYLLHEQPTILALMGVSLGALLGSVLPLSRREAELMGEAGDDLRARMREDFKKEMESERGANKSGEPRSEHRFQ